MTDLASFQREIDRVRRERGFTTEPTRLLTLIVEELGEVAREIKRTWSPNYDAFDPDRLAPELADTFVLLAALASEFKIDLGDAVQLKFFAADSQRQWPSSEHS